MYLFRDKAPLLEMTLIFWCEASQNGITPLYQMFSEETRFRGQIIKIMRVQRERCLSTSRATTQYQKARTTGIYLLTALTIAIFCLQFPRPRRIETSHTKTTCGHHSEILGELRTHLICNAFWPHLTLLSDDKLTSPLLETTHPTL